MDHQRTQRNLISLPGELLLEILSFVQDVEDKAMFASTCRRSYNLFILEVYYDVGKQLKWQPMLRAAEDGNCLTLARCLEAGAPVDHRHGRHTLRPLQAAVKYYHPLAVEFLLEQGASPNYVDGDAEGFGNNDMHMGLSSPLGLAFDRALTPFILYVPIRWRRKEIYTRGPRLLEENACQIITALRDAGANEPDLGERNLEHLDFIEAGQYCCFHHRSRVWLSFIFDVYPFLGSGVICLIFGLVVAVFEIALSFFISWVYYEISKY